MSLCLWEGCVVAYEGVLKDVLSGCVEDVFEGISVISTSNQGYDCSIDVEAVV